MKRKKKAPLYLLKLPALLSSADLTRLARLTEGVTFSPAYEDRHIGTVDRYTWRPPRAKVASSGTAATFVCDDDDDDDDDDDEDFDPNDPDPCSCFASADCPQWLFRKLKAAVREGARRWPSALPSFSRGRVRYENIHAMRYGVGDCKSWHLDAFPKSKRPKGLPSYEDARALSVVVCLKPCDGGGEFQVVRGSAPGMLASGEPVGKPISIPLAAGDAVVFPAKRLMHQISAVTRGQRKSIAVFARIPTKEFAQESDESADSDFDEVDEDEE